MIRIWKLGSLEHKIIPTVEEIEAFKKLLEDARASGNKVEDIVWGPDIEVITVNDPNDFTNYCIG